MLACKRRKLDGITYYSKQIPSELLACNVGVNLVLFAKYNGEESLSEICQHLEVGTSFNFALFKQLLPCQLYKTYELRALSTPYINNVGTKNHFFPYTETQFFEFDKYLFGRFLLSKISVELKRDLHPIGAQVPLAIFGYSSMTSNIIRAPSLKLFWKIRQSVMV